MPSVLHGDKYALNMAYAAWKRGVHETQVSFEAFFRIEPFGGSYTVFAGRERIVQHLNELRFTAREIAWVDRQPEKYDPNFIQYLDDFVFRGNVWCMAEGGIAFPREPLLRVDGTFLECLLVEASILNFVGYQTLIATKAHNMRKIVGADRVLMEFGLRRAQEHDAALWGSRAALIGGFNSTSNMEAGMEFDIPAVGTHAHAWVQFFEDGEYLRTEIKSMSSELEAFRAFAEVFPDDSVLLLDTYNTLESGLPNAITVAKELEASGHKLKGIRLDSGDLITLSRTVRERLDAAGLQYVKICVSNDLDEESLADIMIAHAPIDIFGVGTKLITCYDQPALGCVYKLVRHDDTSVCKYSEDAVKRTIPGAKRVSRMYNTKTKKYVHDELELDAYQVTGEDIDNMMRSNLMPIPLFDLVVFEGRRVHGPEPITAMQEWVKRELALFNDTANYEIKLGDQLEELTSLMALKMLGGQQCV